LGRARKIVTATRGNVVRAEPILTLYPGGEVDHAGTFAELDVQAVNITTAGYSAQASKCATDSCVGTH
jgi:phage terminase large subunit-like protein